MPDRKLKRCMRESFSYADDWKNARELVKKRECWAGTLIMDRIVKSLKTMRQSCNMGIDESIIRDAEDMQEMFAKHQPADKLTFQEAMRLDTILNNMEEKVKYELWRE